MSDHFTTLIPLDPRCVVGSEALERLCAALAAWAPRADEVVVEHHGGRLEFFDCGGNFERVGCPSCGADVEAWWSDALDRDSDSERGFRLEAYPTPCCGAKHTVDELAYEWPMGIAGWGVSARNADRGTLGPEDLAGFERVAGVPLRVILCRL